MKNARFFCESCGRAVPFNADMCPNCGKTFDAVKCPVCKYTGMPGEFLQGCPQCGYLASEPDDAGDAPSGIIRGGKTGAKKPLRQEPGGAKISVSRQRKERDVELFSEGKERRSGLHSWSYYLILVLLFAILISMGILLLLIM